MDTTGILFKTNKFLYSNSTRTLMTLKRFVGIDIDATFFKRNKIVKTLKDLQQVDPFVHSIVVQQIDSIRIADAETRREEEVVYLHKNSLNTHPAWLASWIVRFALEREQVQSPENIKKIQLDTIRNMIKRDNSELSLKDLRFIQNCADRLQ